MSKATEILKVIKEAVEEHPEFGQVTQILYDPDKLDNKVSFGILHKDDKGRVRKRFHISVDDHAFGSAFESQPKPEEKSL